MRVEKRPTIVIFMSLGTQSCCLLWAGTKPRHMSDARVDTHFLKVCVGSVPCTLLGAFPPFGINALDISRDRLQKPCMAGIVKTIIYIYKRST